MSDRPSYGLTYRHGRWVIMKRAAPGLQVVADDANLAVALEKAHIDAGMPLMIPLVPAS